MQKLYAIGREDDLLHALHDLYAIWSPIGCTFAMIEEVYGHGFAMSSRLLRAQAKCGPHTTTDF